MVVHPRGDHVRVLLVVVVTPGSRLTKCFHCAGVEADVITVQCFVSPKDVLSPKVGVLTAFVHSSVWLESILDVQLVLLNSGFDVFRVGISSQDPIEVSTHAILLIVEAVVIGATNRENVLGHQFAKHAPIIKSSSVSLIVG